MAPPGRQGVAATVGPDPGGVGREVLGEIGDDDLGGGRRLLGVEVGRRRAVVAEENHAPSAADRVEPVHDARVVRGDDEEVRPVGAELGLLAGEAGLAVPVLQRLEPEVEELDPL